MPEFTAVASRHVVKGSIRQVDEQVRYVVENEIKEARVHQIGLAFAQGRQRTDKSGKSIGELS